MAELSTLYSDHIALQEQLADVQARLGAKKGDYTAACNALLEQWEQDNAGLLAEHDHIIEAESRPPEPTRFAPTGAALVSGIPPPLRVTPTGATSEG